MPRPRFRERKTSRIQGARDLLISRSAFCTIAGVSEHQLAVWEHEEFLLPARVLRSRDGVRQLYDRAGLERARVIRSLERDLEVNLPGIGVILHLLDRLGH